MAAATQFTVRNPVIEGRTIKFIADFKDAGGVKVSEQTLQCAAGKTLAEQQMLMAQAANREIAVKTDVAAAVVFVPNGTTLSLALATPADTALQTLVKTLQTDLRRHREAQQAVKDKMLLAADNQVVNREAAAKASFDAVVAASNLNTALAVLL